jgi:hypothetical protein
MSPTTTKYPKHTKGLRKSEVSFRVIRAFRGFSPSVIPAAL